MANRIIKPSLGKLEHLVGDEVNRAIFFLALDECGTIEPLLRHLRRLWNHGLGSF